MTAVRLLNIVVIAALVLAAAYVYKIKFDATLQAESVAKLRQEVRQERDSVAALRAQWSALDNPSRIQALAQRHLKLKAIEATQFEPIERLPERPPQIVPPDATDPIGAIIEDLEERDLITGSLQVPEARPQ